MATQLRESERARTRMPIAEAANRFLNCRSIAVTGVSRTPATHGANVIYRRLRDRGYQVYPVNPHAEEVEGDRCYPDLKSIPDHVGAVVIATAPEHALASVQECADLGIENVWMHRAMDAGSVSHEAAELARGRGLTVIEGGCPLMFSPVADPGHRAMKFVLTLTGRVPRTVESATG